MFDLFTPKWKKEAALLVKGGQKFLNYKRDLLSSDRVDEIVSRIDDLKKTIKAGDKEACEEAGKQLRATCENALPRYKAPSAVAENVEVFFVAIVIALGIRAYYLQPFKIPTGSMQPTLNGIVGHPTDSTDEFPALPMQWAQKATHGRNYVDLVLDSDKTLRSQNPIVESPFMHFFTRTKIHFTDGTSLTFPGPKSALMRDFGFADLVKSPNTQEEAMRYGFEHQQKKTKIAKTVTPTGKTIEAFYNIELKKGTVIARGHIDTGDLVLVDKFSYHFRTPTRGEVFVFDTRNIEKIHQQARSTGSPAGSHYIKRLCGVPGDSLQLKAGDDYDDDKQNGAMLYINGELASESGIQKVMSNENGYHRYQLNGHLAAGRTFKARKSDTPGFNEYIALGDNSYNSFDSRGWGTVKEYNLIGPAAISLWPFGSGHWGFIK
ncbi:signal peptidase I [Persicirhabdus sediminis]|uniref:Signal peptidase I n=1 Tax=Persicirhabdus sediminis TaxID=454144 RepID=A0A8J7MB03_9BACT|nr:signal peptidase I [Persicirhabdus sediminis]MBK1790127.1 signal peptidase I [Persicirhabdus sediminis]